MRCAPDEPHRGDRLVAFAIAPRAPARPRKRWSGSPAGHDRVPRKARRQLPGESKRPSRWPKPRDRFPRNASRGQLRPCDRSPSIASSHGLSAALPSRANPEAGATRSAACRTPRHSAASKHSIVSPRRCWCLLLARFRQRRVSYGLAIGANQVSRDRHEHTGIERIAAPLACAATALRPRQSGGMTTSGRSRRGSRFRFGRLPYSALAAAR